MHMEMIKNLVWGNAFEGADAKGDEGIQTLIVEVRGSNLPPVHWSAFIQVG